MSYVFDASSVLVLTRELGEEVIDVVKGNVTADLIFYEVGNAVWKECRFFRRLSVTEAVKTLDFISSLLDVMEVFVVKDSGLGGKVLANAVKLEVSYYDAVYLTLAEEIGGVLVTDDTKLAEASKTKGVKTLRSESFTSKNDRRS